MRPINFKEANVNFAKDQPQYQKLPAFKGEDGLVVSCWTLSLKERFKILFGKNIYVQNLTFNTPLQPQLLSLNFPK